MHRVLLAAAAAVIAAALPLLAHPPLELAAPPQAKAPLPVLFFFEDYPASALAARQQGIVEADIGIGPDGRVHSCAIVLSSRSAALDSTTCRLLRARARFMPARNADGAAVPAGQRVRLTWTLPQAGPVSSRRPVVTGGVVPGSTTAAPLPPGAPTAPAGPAAVPLRPKASLSSLFSKDDYPASALAGREQGRVDVLLQVGSNGRVNRCEIARSSGFATIDATTAIATDTATMAGS